DVEVRTHPVRPSLRLSVLERVPHEPIDQPDTETGSALVPGGAGFIGPDHASDVEVRPGGIVLNEALNELRRSDRTGPARPHVLDVGDRRIDELVVSGGEREAPQLVTARLPRRTQLV